MWLLLFWLDQDKLITECTVQLLFYYGCLVKFKYIFLEKSRNLILGIYSDMRVLQIAMVLIIFSKKSF